MRIPRIFHQIWVGPEPFPSEFLPYQRTWLDLNPGWELRLWTEETLPGVADVRRPEALDPLRQPVERADILRLEVVRLIGGVHVDCDFECLRPIDELLAGIDFFIAVAKRGRVNGALFGSVPGHPILEDALASMRLSPYGGYDKARTGPKFLDDLLARHEGVTYVEPKIFFPRTLEERRDAFAVHHRARSWKDAESLGPELAKFERKTEERSAEAREWQRRYEEARAELDRLGAA